MYWPTKSTAPIEDDDTSLTILVNGELRSVIAFSTCGMMLQVNTGSGMRLIGEGMAADRARFWRIWQKLREHQPPIKWADGREFRPPV